MADDDRGFANRLPAVLFGAGLRPVFDDGLAFFSLAAVVVAGLLMLSHLFGITETSHLAFRRWLQVVFDPPTGLRIAGLLVLAGASASLRRTAREGRPGGAAVLDAALVTTLILSVVMMVGSVAGVLDYITYLGSALRSSLDAICFELAVLVLALTAGGWSLRELAFRRRSS